MGLYYVIQTRSLLCLSNHLEVSSGPTIPVTLGVTFCSLVCLPHWTRSSCRVGAVKGWQGVGTQ